MAGGVDKPVGSAAESIFMAALEVPRSERSTYLAGACGDNEQLRQRVEALLQAHDAPEGFLPEQPGTPHAESQIRTTLFPTPLSEEPGDIIGRYKLRQKLGEGGCGVVYLAEQEAPVRRKVALKIIKLGMDTRQVVARFEAERQALALMNHANIAKVLDAGATETGRPYFVMELVGGIKITDYCEQNDVTTRERLNLFIQVCRAIQHAHQKGIIHRDIKPSNVLVTAQDGVAVPKVIDFGIAKATQGKLTDDTLFTAFEQFLGTPAYMSPEQAQLGSLDVDTRSDIYSLGVLLYELLTGKTPFETKELLAAGLDAMRRTIQEKEPPTPSTRLKQAFVGDDVRRLKSSAADTASAEGGVRVSSRRLLQSRDLLKAVQGDLDWIVMKCLEKDRARRYETANGLATDIERHLRNEPVAASPPSKLYRIQKLMRRNRLAFIAAATVFTSLVIGLGLSNWALRKERKAKQEQVHLRKQAEANEIRAQANEKKAEREREKSEQVARLFKETLSEVSPYKAFGRDRATLQYILHKAAERISRDFTNQPEVEAELCYTLGDAYLDLLDRDKAETMHRKALEIRRKLAHGDDLAVADSLCRLCAVVAGKANPEEAEPLAREAVEMTRRLGGNDDPALAKALFWQGGAFWRLNKPAENETCDREAVRIQRKRLPPGDPELARSLRGLGVALQNLGNFREAETMFQEALLIRRQAFGEEHPLVAEALGTLGNFLNGQGRTREAEDVLDRALVMQRRLFGNEHPALAHSILYLADALSHQGRLAEAEKLWRELLTHRQDPSWQSTSGVADCISTAYSRLLVELRRQGCQAEAQALLEDQFGHGNPSDLDGVAWFLEISGHVEAADGADELRFAEKAAAQTNRKEAYILDTLAAAYARAGDFDKAISVQNEAISKSRDETLTKQLRPTLNLYEIGFSISRVRDLKHSGKAEEASVLVERAFEQLAVPNLNTLAWRLAVNPHAQLDDSLTAVRFAEKAVAATARTNANYLDTLAAAYASAGDFPKAVAAQKEVLALLSDEKTKSDFKPRLQLYESNTAYREQ